MMGTRVMISRESDAALAAAITAGQADHIQNNPQLPHKPVISPALGVHGDVTLRPISVMLELALGTVLNEDPDIAAFARHWSIFRYLGVFAKEVQTGRLHLDTAALKYIGANQRRVLSEELGIGFGIIVAKQWCKARNPGIGPITVIDVDKALKKGQVPLLEDKKNGRQPDYLLSYFDPTNPRVKIYDLLETKGTADKSNAKKQLSRAVTQLAGLTLNGQPMTGIAISTVSKTNGFHVMAVDPEEEPTTWEPTNEALEYWRTSKEPFRQDDFKLDLPREEFLATATNVGFASLADFSGQQEVATRWLPNLDTGRKTKTNADVSRRTASGSFVGTEYVVEIPGTSARLRVFRGAEEHVVGGLRALDATAVLGAQRAFAETHVDEFDTPHESNDNSETVSAVTSDGSMLEISLG